MRIYEAAMTAARKPAATVARLQRAPQCRWHRAGFTADIEWIARGILGDVQQAAVASDAANRARNEHTGSLRAPHPAARSQIGEETVAVIADPGGLNDLN